MVAKIQGAQRDFSYGEVDVALKRSDDHPARKAGLRQMANARILNSGSVQNRSGRRALFPVTPGILRIEKFTIGAGHNYKIAFGQDQLQIIDSTETAVLSQTGFPWTQVNLGDIQFCVFQKTVIYTFPHMRPQVLTWDGVATWTRSDYTELTNGGQKRTPFYRLSPQGIALAPAAQTGSGVILNTLSSPLFVPGHVNTRIRFVGRQLFITAVNSPTQAVVTIMEPVPGSQELSFATDPSLIFKVGDEVIGSLSGSKGVIASVNAGGTNNIIVQLLTSNTTTVTTFQPFVGPVPLSFAFIASDVVSGPAGSLPMSGVSAIGAPQFCTVWDDEVMNDFRDYPSGCFSDQFRLGFTGFPPVPGGICWSAINSPADIYVGANPPDAMFEITPAKTQVQYVVPGPESSEFVFCTDRIYYIPISPTNPLRPGSVQFLILSGDGAALVQPRIAQEAILYVNSGKNSMMAIIATGAYYRPFNTKNLSEFHSHLFNNIKAIAAPNADGTFNERYTYVLNGDGTIAVGKYSPDSLQTGQPVIGWGPFSGAAVVNWISAFDAEVLFTSSYFGTGICEVLDDTKYLDCSLSVNAPPTPFAAPAGKGPLWFIPSQTVSLMDQVTRAMGTYQIDANGFIVPQFNGGEDLTLASLVAGQPWTMTVEPFCPDASPGQDVGQRMFKRRVARFAAYVVNSTGFVMARLFSGPITPTSPALGTVMNNTRFPAWNQGDDPTKPPPLRETVERTRPLGRAFDPRVAVIKDTPGPLLIAELGFEATI